MRPLDADFADLFAASKAEFVVNSHQEHHDVWRVKQTGAVTVPWHGDRPPWPEGLAADEPVIETFVGTDDGTVAAMSDHQPFVALWLPIAVELNTTVRRALARHGIELDGDAYITASLTAVADLEGTPHVDDATFDPDDCVGVVAIVGQHAGARVASEAIAHDAIRPFTQLRFADDVLERFARDELACNVGAADAIVLFPQFAQLHAGPAAHDVQADGDGFRQLFVLRARTITRRRPTPR